MHNLPCMIRLCGPSLSHCGYCNGDRASLVLRSKNESSKSYGILIPSNLSPQIYHILLHRGWRRSGQHLYLPDNWDTCCPAYTIRLPVSEFVPTKSQRKVLARMKRHLERGHGTPNRTPTARNVSSKNQSNDISLIAQLNEWTTSIIQDLTKLKTLPVPVRYKVPSNDREDSITVISTICAAIAGPSKGIYDRDILVNEAVQRLQSVCPSWLDIHAHEPSGQIVCRIPKDKLPNASETMERTISMEAEVVPEDELGNWFQKRSPSIEVNEPYAIAITTIPADESSLMPDVHQLYFEYQQHVHKDPSPLSNEGKVDWGDASTQYIKQAMDMLHATYSDLSTPDSMKMISSFSSFYRFLVETPLTNTKSYGTFHQHYRINGILIAVGVVDVLLEGMSSVYAFYHSEFARTLCPLGKFMILKEIEYCQQNHLPYYYLGYYIHSCGKMRYKADYVPSQLLCPDTFRWIPAEEGQTILDRESPTRNICRLSPDSILPEAAVLDVSAITESIQLYVGIPNHVNVTMLNSNGQEIVRPLLEEFVRHVGPDVSRQCIVKLA
jgi:arginyl-tRNA---protein transferase